MPKFIYRAAVLTLDKQAIKNVNSVIYNFLSNGKPDKIKRQALISDYKDGGLKMPHIESLIQTQRIMCLKKYVEDYKCPWKSILSHYLKNQGGKFLLHCNFNITDLSKNLPIFYRECLDAWADLNVAQIDSRDHVLNQILWNNQYLRIGDKPQFCKKLYTEGITHFKDILSPSGKLMPWQHFKEKGVSSCDYLLLIGLSKALPDTWKALLKSYTDNTPPQTASNPFTIAEFSLNRNGANINLNKLT